MPTLKIKFNDTFDSIQPKMFINGNKAKFPGFNKGYQFEITESETVKIQILNKVQTKGDKILFCIFAFFDILTSDIGQFLKNQCEFLHSEYEIVLTDDAEIEIKPTKEGFIISKHSESCQIISEKHEKEKIPKRLLRAALASIFVLIEIPFLAFLILGILGLSHSDYGISTTMFALALIWGILTGYGLKQTFKK